eukprot:scaffold25410_cov64-Phaeocystis_antarctica.AAC.4
MDSCQGNGTAHEPTGTNTRLARSYCPVAGQGPSLRRTPANAAVAAAAVQKGRAPRRGRYRHSFRCARLQREVPCGGCCPHGLSPKRGLRSRRRAFRAAAAVAACARCHCPDRKREERPRRALVGSSRGTTETVAHECAGGQQDVDIARDRRARSPRRRIGRALISRLARAEPPHHLI